MTCASSVLAEAQSARSGYPTGLSSRQVHRVLGALTCPWARRGGEERAAAAAGADRVDGGQRPVGAPPKVQVPGELVEAERAGRAGRAEGGKPQRFVLGDAVEGLDDGTVDLEHRRPF